jgi:hypothetical protein
MPSKKSMKYFVMDGAKMLHRKLAKGLVPISVQKTGILSLIGAWLNFLSHCQWSSDGVTKDLKLSFVEQWREFSPNL